MHVGLGEREDVLYDEERSQADECPEEQGSALSDTQVHDLVHRYQYESPCSQPKGTYDHAPR